MVIAHFPEPFRATGVRERRRGTEQEKKGKLEDKSLWNPKDGIGEVSDRVGSVRLLRSSS